MLSEHIFFVGERISDILNFDKGRNEILRLFKDFSDDDRKLFVELYSDGKKWEILETCWDDKIRIISELYSDNERKEILKLFLFDPMEETQKLYSDDESKENEIFYSDDNKKELLKSFFFDPVEEIRNFLEMRLDDPRWIFLELYSGVEIWEINKLYLEYMVEKMQKSYFWSDDDQRKAVFLILYLLISEKQEFNQMYWGLSHDDREEFLDKYNYSWREKILKYLELRKRCFQKHHAETFLEIITFLMSHEEGEDVVLSTDVKKGIGELQKELLRIHNYLKDVEAKYDNRQVLSEYEQQFYLNLSYIAHSSDDILDRIMSNYHSSHQTLDGVTSKDDIDTLLEKIRNSYHPSSTGFKLKVIVEGNTSYGTQNIANSNITINHSKPSNNYYSRPKTYAHVSNHDLVGFNHEINILLHHLTQSHDETRVLAIVGPGGSGKTTLVKHIYHHPKIKTQFTHRVWVCVSQSWDKASILNGIRRQVIRNPNALEMGYDQVVDCLSELLCSESYLVILDDVWSIDAWYDISSPLPAISGSKVVITTRDKLLPRHIDPRVIIVPPKQLNDEECYELFKKRALLDENAHHELQSLGVEMVKKCKGLPLAIVALAGVLGIDKRLSSWERISKRVTDKILNMANESTQGVVKEILALSYYELHDNLKPCALYLRVFPEDYVIEAQKLIQMWIAECFMEEEYEAEEYLDEMVQRCIVEVVRTNWKGQVLEFRIHDLIRQMFINIDKERDILKNQVLRLAPSTILYDGFSFRFSFNFLVFFIYSR